MDAPATQQGSQETSQEGCECRVDVVPPTPVTQGPPADQRDGARPFPGSGRRTRSESEIKRPLNSFMLYRRERSRELPTNNNQSISRIIGKLWQQESRETKDRYALLAEHEAARHAREHPEYRYRPRRTRSNTTNGRRNDTRVRTSPLRTNSSTSVASTRRPGSHNAYNSALAAREQEILNHLRSQPPESTASPELSCSPLVEPRAVFPQPNLHPQMAPMNDFELDWTHVSLASFVDSRHTPDLMQEPASQTTPLSEQPYLSPYLSSSQTDTGSHATPFEFPFYNQYASPWVNPESSPSPVPSSPTQPPFYLPSDTYHHENSLFGSPFASP